MRAFFELVPCKMSIAEGLHDGFFYHRGGTHKAGLWARTVVHSASLRRSNPAPGKKHYVTPHT